MDFIVGLFITVIEFGIFPIIWAYMRKDTISAKKYRWICFGVNFAINLVLHVLITSSAAGVYSAAYVLWTVVFSAVGVKILNNRNVLEQQEDVIAYCTTCGIVGKCNGGNSYCPNCKQEPFVTTISVQKWYTSSREEQEKLLDSWGIKNRDAEPVIRFPQKEQPQKEQPQKEQPQKEQPQKEQPQKEQPQEEAAALSVADLPMLYCPKCDKLWKYVNASKGTCPSCNGKVSNVGVTPKIWYSMSETEKADFANNLRGEVADLSVSVKKDDSSSEKKDIPSERIIKAANNTIAFCRKCGARIPSDSVFCQKCGEKVVRIE